ncbi:MAG TPA: NADH-quinone oxidoreductase subunit H, partial [Labilithrix sp.]
MTFTLSALIWTVVKIAVMLGFLLNVAGLLTWYDRRGGAMMQDRIGPNRASIAIGKFQLRIAGLLHTAADGVKFFTKEDFMPPKADKLLFSLAPILAMMPVLALVAVIPMGDTLSTDLLWKQICTKDGAQAFVATAGQCISP